MSLANSQYILTELKSYYLKLTPGLGIKKVTAEKLMNSKGNPLFQKSMLRKREIGELAGIQVTTHLSKLGLTLYERLKD